ncbi:MAG: Rne/Rng family ribonuclease [Alphaproteobacteria bacterium]|nr:Rne/Rng family ribonuclease [Alphaproteobacteria bacterium]
MSKKMLIDATHEEEVRVAVTDGNKLVEYDYESQSRKPLKGSIFLAKVTRVEPSLQAAFVNFGGNRHGFLPFSEIHPDYFKIPVADREALMAEQEALLKEHDEEEEQQLEEAVSDDESSEKEFEEDIVEEVGGQIEALENEDVTDSEEESKDEVLEKDSEDSESDENNKETQSQDNSGDEVSEDNYKRYRGRRGGRRGGRRRNNSNPNVEVVGGDEIDEEQRFRFNLRRKYKIQEVVKRGQIVLIQVNKEERGNKGAAVGSYLSLPGRYCVLMPNSPRAGGVSRKIANHKDRARMREIVKSLEVPKGMSVIVRTAGVTRTKTEIKRDLSYLMRLWNNIREQTLQSSAPALIYEEADLIKRAVRDLYTRDIDEVIVSGDEGFKAAKEFMKMMIPSHVKKVTQYEDKQLPLFNRYQVEAQVEEIGQPVVNLRSGGYLVINPTEALISIDVNSGKATKGRHIEETALKTNLEAAQEVARQLKLRDLGGLVVIDFIDMEDRRNNGKVERKMKEALAPDRARVQVGRISSFGLMELSRQRLSPSLTEAQYEVCKSCNGIGLTRTSDAMSIIVLRAIEEEGIRGRASQIIAHVTKGVALYILNHKRANLAEIEKRYGFQALIRIDDDIACSDYRIEVSMPADKVEAEDSTEAKEQNSDSEDGKNEGGRNRRRSGRGGRNKRYSNDRNNQENISQDRSEDTEKNAEKPGPDTDAEDKSRKTDQRKSPKSADDASVAAKADKKGEGEETKDKKPKASAKRKTAKPRKPSNDDLDVEDKADKESKLKPETDKKSDVPVNKDYEIINEVPDSKKKGWWNKFS